MIVLQHVVTIWTKRTRGAEGREQRARLPTWYPVPEGLLASARRFLRQQIRRDEWHGWSATPQVEVSDRVRGTDAVTLAEEGGALAVAFLGGACGRPRRDDAKVVVPAGRHLTVRFNGRIPSYDDPWYEDHIVHVAFDPPPSLRMFADDDLVLERRVDLW